MKKTILFIINPVSGGRNKNNFPEVASRYLNEELYSPEYVFTRYGGHAFAIAGEAVARDTDVIVAVGGDGTVNEIASAMVGSKSSMGIVPCGSGNGLARSLSIPLKLESAVSRLNHLRTRIIDTGILNGEKFVNMAGIGFDAHISHKFASLTSRGFPGYVRTAFREILNYRPKNYKVEIDGLVYERTAFMISVANSPQYGNNAYISPQALLDDNLLDVCIVKPFPLALFPIVGLHMFARTSHKSKYVEIIKGKNIRIQSDNRIIHLDGDPREVDEDICISVKPSSLSVLY